MDQNQQPAVFKSHSTTYLVMLIAGIILGTFSTGWVARPYFPEGVTNENTYEAGWNAAKERLASSAQFKGIINTQSKVMTLSGVVESVSGDKINIKINPLEPLASPNLDNRAVITTSATKITRIIQPDQEAFRKEMEVFIKNIQTAPKKGIVIRPPEQQPPTKQEAKFSDIKVGDAITATAAENIKESQKFTATEIQIN